MNPTTKAANAEPNSVPVPTPVSDPPTDSTTKPLAAFEFGTAEWGVAEWGGPATAEGVRLIAEPA